MLAFSFPAWPRRPPLAPGVLPPRPAVMMGRVRAARAAGARPRAGERAALAAMGRYRHRVPYGAGRPAVSAPVRLQPGPAGQRPARAPRADGHWVTGAGRDRHARFLRVLA